MVTMSVLFAIGLAIGLGDAWVRRSRGADPRAAPRSPRARQRWSRR
jgi:hypothetical protein